MEWRDTGIVLGLRRLGEASVIVEMMTLGHGRHLGLARGGRSARMRPILQPGNEVQAVWRARLDEQLGQFTIEAGDLHAGAALTNARSLHGINLLCALLRFFPERDPHPELFELARLVLRHIDEPELGPALMVRLELTILSELGFGLDLARCAVTGQRDDLAFVSPKTGRAVSRDAGGPWQDRLLALPPFLGEEANEAAPTEIELADAFRLTGHFLLRDVLAPRGMPPMDARRAYLATLTRAASPTD